MRVLLLLIGLLIGMPALAAEPIDQATFAENKSAVPLRNGETLAYAEFGDPKGPPVILIHGMTDNARSWSLLIPHLDPGLHLIAVDLRGHGKSSAPPCCYGLRDLASDVIGLMDALKIEKASIVGHSLGSMVGQVLAARWPDRVDRLVLISSTTSGATAAAPDGWLATNIAALKAPIDPDSQFMQDWYANPNPVDPTFLRHEIAESATVPLQVWHGVLDTLRTEEFGRYAPDIKAPVLILMGGKDGLFGEKDREALQKALPAAKLQLFDQLGHNLFWEDPAAAAAAINPFLKP